MLKVITGRSGAGKTTQMVDEIVKRLEAGTDLNMILFVPEQMSFQAELEIAKRIPGKTMANLQVLSFKRLAYRIFLEVGGANKTFINDQAIEMLITKIVLAHQNELRLYQKMGASLNFVSLMHDVIREFKQYAINPETLQELVNQPNLDETLRDKLHDFQLIYGKLIEAYGQALFDQEDFYRELCERIKESTYIQNAHIYIDGYHSMNQVELLAVESMIQCAKEVKILLTIDDLSQPHKFYEPDQLFHVVYRMAKKLFTFCESNQIAVEIQHLTPKPLPRFKNPELAFLEANFDQPENQYPNQVNAISVHACFSPKGEIHHIARTIYEQVLQGASYCDFAIFTNNESLYYPLIKNIFRLYQIPIFIDDRQAMLDHSLLNFIDACLEIVRTNYRHEAMFRAIKTEMFMPLEMDGVEINEMNYAQMVKRYRETIDQLENYCLSHGISSYHWQKERFELELNYKLADRKVKTDADLQFEAMLNDLKSAIMAPLKKFVDQFNAGQTVKAKILALYELLMEVQAERKLQLYEILDMNQGQGIMDLNQAKKHKQVYNQLMELLEQLVLVGGDEVVSTEDLIKILATGFKTMTFSIIPPALEQVMVGNITRSRFELVGHADKELGIKHAFIVGVTDGEFPKILSESGLITNQERQMLKDLELEIGDTIEQNYFNEIFAIYKGMTAASTHLTLTYPLADQAHKETYRSFVIDQLLNQFPQLQIEVIYDFPTPEMAQEPYIATLPITSTNLLSALHLLRKGYEVHPVWRALYFYYQADPVLCTKLLGLKDLNEPVMLNPSDVKNLYGETITASVSSIERFNACPYAYFVERGLGVKEREIKEVDVADIGDLYHETLKSLSLYLLNTGRELKDIPHDELTHRVTEIVNSLAQNMVRNYFFDHPRNEYLLQKIKETLINSIVMLKYQSEYSKFKLVAVEEPFSSSGPRLKMPEMPLPNGFNLQLKGIVDRIDVATIEGQKYLRVIDYKSGSKDIDFNKIYHRLSLQLFTYLDVVIKNSPNLVGDEAIAAGVLYYHICNSQIKAEGDLSEAEITNLHRKEYKMSGYTLENQAVSKLFDTKLGMITVSDIIPVTLTSTGYHKTHAKILSNEEITALRKYTLKAMYQSAVELTEGKIALEPIKYNDEVPCKYCAFKAICKFDPQQNQYKQIPKDKKEVILEKIIAEVRGEQDE